VTELYDWQREVLSAMWPHRNFLFSLPTSSGKTLVAEVAMLRTVLLRGKSAVLVLPFISLAEEKKEGLEPFGEALGFGVHGYYGINGRFPVPKPPSLLICTIEKTNSVVNHLSEEGRLAELGLVAVDELHMLGEEGRGATLELMLTKLRAAAPDTQVVGMSATVPNLRELGDWLGAAVYEHTHRPVPLREFVKVGQQVFDVDGTPTRAVATASEDPQGILPLVQEVCPDSSILMFCATKLSCQECALALCKQLPAGFRDRHAEERQHLLLDLRSCSDVTDKTLQATVPFGVAYHHSGLTMEERELLERAFRQHVVTLLCCTSTLAAGVNLPAQRVIFRTPYVGRSFLTKSRYVQMAGRAGRKGCDPYGESYLLLHPREEAMGWELIRSGLEPCVSQMVGADAALERCVLETVAAGFVHSRSDLRRFVAATFASCGASSPKEAEEMQSVFRGALEALLAAHLLEETAPPTPDDADSPETLLVVNLDEAPADPVASAAITEGTTGRLSATPFGLSAYKGNFTIQEAIFARSEFERLLEDGLILKDELHLCYLVTPFKDLPTPDWAVYLQVYTQMSSTRQRISQMVGVSEGLLVSRSAHKGSIQKHQQHREKLVHDELVLKRFFAALVLCDLVNECPMAQAEAKYKLPRGALQSLLRSGQVFANMMVNFSAGMGWFSLERVLAGYVKRLGFGVKPDLVPLTEIKGVQAARARALWNAGFKTVKDLAKADPETLLRRLKVKCKANRMLSKRAAIQIVESAKGLLKSQAKDLKEEADQLLASD